MKKGLTINEIAEAVHALAKEKGWHDEAEQTDHFIERMCNNIHDEVSELHTAWRDNCLYLSCDKAVQMKEMNLKPLTCLEEEMADIIIRALDACMKLKLNPQDIIARKHIYNTTRPFRHGGKRS